MVAAVSVNRCTVSVVAEVAASVSAASVAKLPSDMVAAVRPALVMPV